MKEFRDATGVDQREVRAEPQGATTRISGEAAVFDQPIELYPGLLEVVRPGAFRASLARKDDVLGLFNHDLNFSLASRGAGNLTLWEDEHGLSYEMRDAWGPTIEDLVVMPIRRGVVKGSSFGFTVDEETWSRVEGGKKELRELLAVTLIDVSPVTRPAYPTTSAEARAYLAGRRQLGHPDPERDDPGQWGRRLRARRLA